MDQHGWTQNPWPPVGPPSPRRRQSDSRLDPDKTIAEQLNLLRVVDEERYPAYFDYRGHSYHMTISAKQDLASSRQSEPCPDSRA
jgi:hypothetical protein